MQTKSKAYTTYKPVILNLSTSIMRSLKGKQRNEIANKPMEECFCHPQPEYFKVEVPMLLPCQVQNRVL